MDSKSALKELKQAQSTRKGAGDYYNKYQQELGVNDVKTRADDMRGLIRNTETALKGVPEAVSGRTRGQLVTEAQRARLSNLEQQPLAEQLSGLQGGYSDEMQSYRDLLGQAGTQTQFAYQSDADKLAALEGNYNRIFQKETAAAEEARWRKQMAEETRRFNQQLAESRRSSQAAIDASKWTPTIPDTPKPKSTDKNKDAAYLSVQNYLSQGKDRAASDYLATLKSADRGNKMDQWKIKLYNQNGIGRGTGGMIRKWL